MVTNAAAWAVGAYGPDRAILVPRRGSHEWLLYLDDDAAKREHLLRQRFAWDFRVETGGWRQQRIEAFRVFRVVDGVAVNPGETVEVR